MGEEDYQPERQTTTIQQRSDARIVELRLDTVNFLDEVQHALEGKVYDMDEDCWMLPEDSVPLIKTKKGILDIVNELKTFVNNNNLLSQYTDEEIGKTILFYGFSLTDRLSANAEEYCDSNTSTLDKIMDIIINNVFAALKRAQGHAESNAISSNQYIEKTVEQPTRRGVLPKMKR